MTLFDDTPGYLYLLHFDTPLGNPDNRRAQASHYLGVTIDLPRRLAEHAAGRGGALTQAAVARGITWEIFYRPGNRALERWLKEHYKKTPCLCPRCAASRQRRPKYGFQPYDQAVMDLCEPLPDFPPPPPARFDGYELVISRAWQHQHTAGAIAGLDDLTVDIPY